MREEGKQQKRQPTAADIHREGSMDGVDDSRAWWRNAWARTGWRQVPLQPASSMRGWGGHRQGL